jgi:hypothetical protein
MLGGNSSSEVRVWVCGSTGHRTHRYVRETGIMGEMFVENQYRNIDGNPYFGDQVSVRSRDNCSGNSSQGKYPVVPQYRRLAGQYRISARCGQDYTC